ncbi:MAG: GNAT family N-acetyltransferase [Gemmatimonadales bacterium]
MSVDLAEAAAENASCHSAWVQTRVPTMRASLAPDLVLADCGFDCDTFNSVFRTRLTPATARDRALEAIAWFEGRPFSWWVAPGDSPADLGPMLESLGLVAAEGELAMACELADVRDAGDALGELEVGRVRTPEELELYAALLAALWDPPDQGVIRFYGEGRSHLLAERCPLRLYLGRWQGTPVATAELAVTESAVGLYNISTRSDHRGRGIGSAITLAPLLEAKAEGHGLAVLQAAPAGVAIYRRVGFRPYGEIVEYKPTGS